MDSDQAVIVAAAAADWDAALASVVMLLQVISMAVSFLAGLFMWRLVVLSKNQRGGFWLVGPVVLVLGSSAWAAPVVSFSTVSSDGNGSTVGGPFYVVQVTDSSTNYQVATFWTQADSVNGKCESSYVHTVGAFGVETYSAWATSIGSTWLSYFTTNVASDNGANAFLSDWSSNGATIWNQFLTQVVAGSVTYSDANWWTFYQAALAASPITSCMPGSSSPPSGWSSTFYSTLYGRSGSWAFAWNTANGCFEDTTFTPPRYFWVPVQNFGASGYQWYFSWENGSGTRTAYSVLVGTFVGMSGVAAASQSLYGGNGFECYANSGLVQHGAPNSLPSSYQMAYQGSPTTWTWNSAHWRYESGNGQWLQYFFPAGASTVTTAGWYVGTGTSVYSFP